VPLKLLNLPLVRVKTLGVKTSFPSGQHKAVQLHKLLQLHRRVFPLPYRGHQCIMVSKYRSNWHARHLGYQGAQNLVDSQAGVNKLITGHRHSGKQPQNSSIDRTTMTTDFIHPPNHQPLQGFLCKSHYSQQLEYMERNICFIQLIVFYAVCIDDKLLEWLDEYKVSNIKFYCLSQRSCSGRFLILTFNSIVLPRSVVPVGFEWCRVRYISQTLEDALKIWPLQLSLH